jgi:prevent-host-death family protein
VAWQVQEAKQRFSELLRAAQLDGPQFVTKHGQEVAVLIDVVEYRHLCGQQVEFKDYLREGPGFDDLDLSRSTEPPRDIDWAERG